MIFHSARLFTCLINAQNGEKFLEIRRKNGY